MVYVESWHEKLFILLMTPILWLLALGATLLLVIDEWIRTRKIPKNIALMLLFFVLAIPAHAVTTIYPSTDTEIYNGAPNTNYSSATQVGINHFNADDEKYALKLDLSTIPDTASLSAVTFHYYPYSKSSTSGTTYLDRILSGNSTWTASTATWNYQDGSSTAWAGSAGASTSGTDYSATPLGTANQANYSAGSYVTMTVSVSEFKLMESSNYGAILQTHTGENGNQYIYANGGASPPYFELTYSAPSPTPTPTPQATSSGVLSQVTVPVKIWTGTHSSFGTDNDIPNVFYPDVCTWGEEYRSASPHYKGYYCYIAPDLSAFNGRGSDITDIVLSFTTARDDFPLNLSIGNGTSTYSGTLIDIANGFVPYAPQLVDYNLVGTTSAVAVYNNPSPTMLHVKWEYWSTLVDVVPIIKIQWGQDSDGDYHPNDDPPNDNYRMTTTSIPVITVFYTGLPVEYSPTTGQYPSPFPTSCSSILDVGCNILLALGNIFKWVFGWNLLTPTGVDDMATYVKDKFNDLVDLAYSKAPWGYLYAIENMSLTDPPYPTAGVIPDFTIGAVQIKVNNVQASTSSTLTLFNQATISGSTYSQFNGAVTSIRNSIMIFILGASSIIAVSTIALLL